MPQQARAEVRAEEGRAPGVPEARGKVVAGVAIAAPEISIVIPRAGIAKLDGTSTTDGAIARKLAAAARRDPAVKVRITYDPALPARLAAIRTLVERAGITDVVAVRAE